MSESLFSFFSVMLQSRGNSRYLESPHQTNSTVCPSRLFRVCDLTLIHSVVLTGRIPPFRDLRYEDLYRLSPREWLNDELLNAGLECDFLFCFLHKLTRPQRMVSRAGVKCEPIAPTHSPVKYVFF
jgi:hypothetical protein